MHDILVGSTLLAAFIGGVVALFAPCCISVMLPAYFATSFRRRRALVGMTFVFGAGIATVILPIAVGASAVSRLILGHHMAVFLVGSVLMMTLGVATVAGWKLPVPMPGMRASTSRGPGAVFVLGAFSGTATACCAPVLAGVVSLSGAAGSFLAAVAIGGAYVFGMVAPLFAMAVVWDRYQLGDSRLLRGRTLTIRLGGRHRSVEATALLSGALLVVMGLLTGILAFTGVSMPRRGWQPTLTAHLQHDGHVLLSALSGIPGWVDALVIFGAAALLARKAIHSYLTGADDDAQSDTPIPPPPTPDAQPRPADRQGADK
ncbi:MAG: cytochrome c biogenesis CcdA family protein [Acidimicrobiales bacterium]